MKTVFLVWDYIEMDVDSIHETLEGAQKAMRSAEEEAHFQDELFDREIQEFELEE